MLIGKFLDYLRIEKNYSNHTITAYNKDLNEFKDFLLNDFKSSNIKNVEYKLIRSWIVSMVNNNLSNRSINRKISSLKSFYKFLVKTQTIKVSPLISHSPLKQSKKIQVPFSKEEIKELLDGDLFKNDYRGILQKTIIQFFYFTGVRRFELISIKNSDIDFDSSSLKIMGKRNKERIIPMLPSLIEVTRDYMNSKIKNSIKSNNDFLFQNSKGDQLSEKFVYRTVNQYFKLVSPKVKKAPHVLRHSFATHLINEGADINSVKELLGHSSLSATQVYSHTSMERIKEVFNNSHPRAK
ncbi:MAG: tyrosine-type recombinase/integrase [Bacteroidota bacterium]